MSTVPIPKTNKWQRQVSEFGGALEGATRILGGEIEFHEISRPPRCLNGLIKKSFISGFIASLLGWKLHIITLCTNNESIL